MALVVVLANILNFRLIVVAPFVTVAGSDPISILPIYTRAIKVSFSKDLTSHSYYYSYIVDSGGCTITLIVYVEEIDGSDLTIGVEKC